MARTHAPSQQEEEPDLFQALIDDLAEELCALPPEAWTQHDATRGAGLPALAKRVAKLKAGRASLREEDDEAATKRRK